MSSEEPLYSVLDFILNQAGDAELEVIGEALRRRRKPGKGLGGISPRGLAENVAKSVQQQLGDMLDVHKISRQIVGDLVRQKEPNISNRDLEVLLDYWLPASAAASAGRGPQQQPPDRAPDVLITMVSQFLAAEQGSLSERERAELPENWQKRYWESFPESTRSLIRSRLSGRLNEVDFWKTLINSLDR